MTASIPYDTISTASRSKSLFTTCCFCIPLRTGCFILGYLTLIFNTFDTLTLLAFITYLGVSTHGFDHFDTDQPREVSDIVTDIETGQKPFLTQIEILLIIVLCANVVWLVINVACLVGLHKKKPGPIRVYVAFASARLVLSLAGVVYLANSDFHTIIAQIANHTLGAYFVFVYYVYAMQLEREGARVQLQSKVPEQSDLSKAISVIYPPTLDKENLVAKMPV